MPVTSIAYFISSHGFGHAARAAAVIQAIADFDPSVQFEIFTAVPAWFFQDSLSTPFNYHIQTEPICSRQSPDLVTAPVSRKPKRSRDKTRQRLGLLTDGNVILITTGGIPQRYDFLQKLNKLMIRKIISGGQTGVDQAALDVAIKLTVAHGGWVPKGRLTESGPLPEKYNLKETRSSSYADRTEKNVQDGDGTLIISRGLLTGGSEYTREMAIKHDRPWLHIDLGQMAAFQAANAINQWLQQNQIEILNVAGPRASKDPAVYRDALNILESAYYLGLAETSMAGAGNLKELLQSKGQPPPTAPRTLDEAVDRLLSNLPLKDKTTVANMSHVELTNLHLTLGGYILNNFGLLSGNWELMKSCRAKTKIIFQHDEDAVSVIIDALWEKLQQTHKLRVVK